MKSRIHRSSKARITSVHERVLTTTVNDIEHIESTTLVGAAIIKLFLQPYANVTTGVAQVAAVLRKPFCAEMPAGTNPPIAPLTMRRVQHEWNQVQLKKKAFNWLDVFKDKLVLSDAVVEKSAYIYRKVSGKRIGYVGGLYPQY